MTNVKLKYPLDMADGDGQDMVDLDKLYPYN